MRKKYKGFKLSYGRVRGRKANVKEVKREKERRRKKNKKEKSRKKRGGRTPLRASAPIKFYKSLISSQPMSESLLSIHFIIRSTSWFIPYRRIHKALPLIIDISL